MKAIETDDLSKTFKGKRATMVEDLKGFNLEIENG